MSICSIESLFFFIAVFVIYYIVPKFLQNAVVIIANMAFCYLFGGTKMILYLLIASVCAYIGAIAIKKLDNKRLGKAIYILAIIVIIGLLFVFKYINFFLQIGQNLQRVITGASSIELFSIIAPVGISFYTLTILSYMLDVTYGIIEPEKNP